MAVIHGDSLGPGSASGESLVLDEPLSFWGGVDADTGEIIDRQHPQRGQHIAGRILVVRHARGSSGTPSVLTETVRGGVGPAGIILQSPDPMFVVGSLVIAELYPDLRCPVVAVGESFDDVRDAMPTAISETGIVTQPD